MKSRTAAILVSLSLIAYLGLSVCTQLLWDASCPYATVAVTPVYIPGTANDIAATLPAGTPCRAADTVGDSWQTIEYRLNGVTATGMVRAGLVQPVGGN